MMMLCHEHDEDPEMRPKSISLEKHAEVIAPRNTESRKPYFSPRP